MDPTRGERKQLKGESLELKKLMDELVHFCDTSRDTLEAYLEGDTIQVPRIEFGDQLVKRIKTKIDSIKDEPAYKYDTYANSAENANELFLVAEKVIAQFERVKTMVNGLSNTKATNLSLLVQLRQDQIQHRMGDMTRVLLHFANKPDLTAEDVATVSNIDYTKPLIPQLGFDPDDV